MHRIGLLMIVLALGVAACGSETSGGSQPDYEGFIVIDSGGSQLCDSLAESYPPQCGGLVVELADLRPTEVVALQSPDDLSLAAVSWTDYTAGVTGTESEGVLTNVVLTDPVITNATSGWVLRVADLGFPADEPFVLPIDLRNASDQGRTLTFTSGQRVELTLSSDGDEVYRWSADMMFTQAIEERTLEAGAIYGTTLTGEAVGLEPGTYIAKAWITATETNALVVEWETTVE